MPHITRLYEVAAVAGQPLQKELSPEGEPSAGDGPCPRLAVPDGSGQASPVRQAHPARHVPQRERDAAQNGGEQSAYQRDCVLLVADMWGAQLIFL